MKKTTVAPPLQPKDINPVIDWIDRELTNTYKLDYGKGTNILLEVRHLFLNLGKKNVHHTLSSFYQLLPKLEYNFYLIGYRIRQWVSINFQLVGRDPLEKEDASIVAICQTMRSLETQRKNFFELFNYSVPFHDLRIRFEKIS